MSREIKFRTWLRDSFHYWGFLREGNQLYFQGIASINESMSYKLEHSQQYTGLIDKNGKEIYEGDIVIIEDTLKDRILDDGSGPTEPANHLAPVVFQDGSFGVYIKEYGDCFDKGFWSFIGIQDNIGMTFFEVIGNIYENPEL